ncbi:MAG: asparagine synthase-related protein [Coxiellaceae bacterium]|nr:asparagine synthase-related protein [Coxiellaceae bacterium]
MSAICGIFQFNQQSVEQQTLATMNNAMATLGPDGSATWLTPQVGLGHQQCCLTLESLNEKLPMLDRDSGIALTTDVRLDNRAELCQYFNLPNKVIICDSTLVLKAYQRWGKECPQKLLGEFSVAIWDPRQQLLLCFTDHGGNRPMYYYRDNNCFAFATEIKALHTLKAIERRPNLQRIATTYCANYNFAHADATHFENIYSLPASTILAVKPRTMTKHRYWQPDIRRRLKFQSESEYREAFQALFTDVVKAKLRSHLPVMTLHSGGLDSSAITAVAAKLNAEKNQSLTALSAVLPADYQGQNYDESHYANQLDCPNLKITPITDDWRGPFDQLQDPTYFRDSPEKTSRHYLYSAFATAAANNGTRIILDGCFGERGPSFHAHGYLAELLLHCKWHLLLRESILHARKYQRNWLKTMLAESAFPLLPALLQTQLKQRSNSTFEEQYGLMRPEFIKQSLPIQRDFKAACRQRGAQYCHHRKHQYNQINSLRTGFGSLLSDNKSPVQLSFPYKDKRLLEFCLALPGDFKMRHGYKRYAIRSGMKGLMPDSLRFRLTKAPFSPDYSDRYDHQLSIAREFVHSIKRTELMNNIVDFESLQKTLGNTMNTNRCNRSENLKFKRAVPCTIYLLAFLKTFS